MEKVRINGMGTLGTSLKDNLEKSKDCYLVENKKQSDPYVNYNNTIIHTSWLTNVDYCENNRKEAEFYCIRPLKKLIKLCEKYDMKLIFISSAYVFSGDLPVDMSYSVSCLKNPINFYGRLKSQAEEMIQDSKIEKWNIVRTDNIYSKNKKPIYKKGATDWISTPTEVGFLSEKIISLIEKGTTNQIHHFVGDEKLSRFDFLKRFNENIKPCKGRELKLSAKRPINSCLKPT